MASPPVQPQTYAQATLGQPSHHTSPPQTPDINTQLLSFLNKFKPLINPLISLLTKVVSGLLDKKMINSATNKSLLVLQFNANGLKNHINKLKNVLYHRRIDITHITETHCTKYSRFHIPGYNLLKVNHPDNTAHGVVAILIKSTLYFQPFPNYCHDHIQSCTILIKLNNIPITIGVFILLPVIILQIQFLLIILTQL